jgi:predicted AAA+ superfamily ATPase
MEPLEMLYRINRWWRTGKVDEVFLYRKTRSEFQNIIELIDEKRILALIGPRRVGKSTLLYQTIDYLLKTGIDPKRILFCGGDEPGLFSDPKTVIRDVIELYLKEIVQAKIEKIPEKIYILIDEIHFLDNWQLDLKSYYDKKYNLKFIISGSSATHLFHHSKESLLGRMEEIFIFPLDFRQFLDFYTVYKENQTGEVIKFDHQTHLLEDTAAYYTFLKAKYHDLIENENPITKILKEYLISGGYPEYFESTNLLLWQKRLVEDIITKGLYRDIVSIYSIKSPEILEKLLYLVAANQGQAFAYTSIAQTIGVDTVTVSSYLTYLAQAFLIGILENYSTNIGKIIRKNKKLYIIDNGIRNALLKVNQFEPAVEGQLIENCTVHYLKLYADQNRYNLFFWRDGQKEVDIILDRKTQVVPVEVKYRNQVSLEDLKGLTAFIAKFQVPYGIVITKNILKKEEQLYYIPFWLSSLI